MRGPWTEEAYQPNARLTVCGANGRPNWKGVRPTGRGRATRDLDKGILNGGTHCVRSGKPQRDIRRECALHDRAGTWRHSIRILRGAICLDDWNTRYHFTEHETQIVEIRLPIGWHGKRRCRLTWDASRRGLHRVGGADTGGGGVPEIGDFYLPARGK